MPRRIYALLALALSAVPALGQCAMCYTGAAAASHGGQAALNRAVLTLLVPPVGIMLGLVGLAFAWDRKGRGEEEVAEGAASRESAAGD